MQQRTCAVVGASGYAGGELVRILDDHPELSLEVLVAHSRAGQTLADVHPQLGGDRVLEDLNVTALSALDVVFLALPHGASVEPGRALRGSGVTVVDLGSDYRLDTNARFELAYGAPHAYPDDLAMWVYALPELFGSSLEGATGLAVPGCYPTATLLGVGPLIAAGLDLGSDVVVDAISGVTGAGRGVDEGLLFGAVAEGAKAYGVGGHRHRPEMEMAIGMLGLASRVTFTPHLAPFQRGLLATASVPTTATSAQVEEALNSAYEKSPLVTVLTEPPQTRWVAGSHGAMVFGTVDKHSGRAVTVCAIDNLGKGAAGQAVQALNVSQGWDESAGLRTDGWLA